MRIQLRDASFIYFLRNGSVSTSGYLYLNDTDWWISAKIMVS